MNELIEAYRDATIEEKRAAFVSMINNQKIHDKSSLGFMIGSIETDSSMRYWPEDYKRKLLVEKLEELVRVDANLLKVTRSDWQMSQIGRFLLKSKKAKNEVSRANSVRPCVRK